MKKQNKTTNSPLGGGSRPVPNAFGRDVSHDEKPQHLSASAVKK